MLRCGHVFHRAVSARAALSLPQVTAGAWEPQCWWCVVLLCGQRAVACVSMLLARLLTYARGQCLANAPGRTVAGHTQCPVCRSPTAAVHTGADALESALLSKPSTSPAADAAAAAVASGLAESGGATDAENDAHRRLPFRGPLYVRTWDAPSSRFAEARLQQRYGDVIQQMVDARRRQEREQRAAGTASSPPSGSG